MTLQSIQRLLKIKAFPSLVKYHRNELDWPIESDNFDDLTFDYEPDELGIDACRHEADTRKNAVSVGLASYDTSKPKRKKYEYDPHTAPQLVLTGKAEHTSYEVHGEYKDRN